MSDLQQQARQTKAQARSLRRPDMPISAVRMKLWSSGFGCGIGA